MLHRKNRYEVSVVIPTYNRREILSYTLLSLTKQDADKNSFEVLVMDDGSTDGTREMVATYQDRLNLSYHFSKHNGHAVSTARNNGVLNAEGRIVLFIDSGLILKPDCVTAHLDFYEKRPTGATVIGYVYGLFAPVEVEEKMIEMLVTDDPAECFRRLSNDKIFMDYRDRHYPIYNDQLQDLPAPWFYYWGAHISANRQDLIDVGLYDENYNGNWGVEDNDIGFRLQQQGIRTYLLRNAQAIHYPHYRSWEAMSEQGTKNCIYFHKKFPTLETELFLRYYLHPDFPDINEMAMNKQIVAQ